MQLFKQLFKTTPSLNPREVSTRLDAELAPLIIDVRQPEEYGAGHIPGAMLIPLNKLDAQIGTLPKDREIVCVCRSGARSGSAAAKLVNTGLKAYNMSGGMITWQHLGLPLKKGGAK